MARQETNPPELLIDPLYEAGPGVGPGVYGSAGGHFGTPIGWAPNSAERLDQVCDMLCEIIGLDCSDVALTAKGDGVVLTGTVADASTRELAGRVAAQLLTECALDNQLVIVGPKLR